MSLNMRNFKYKSNKIKDSKLMQKENYLAMAFFGLLAIVLFGKVLWGFYPMSDKDIVNFFSQHVSSAKYFSHGVFPLWDKNILSGAPSFNYEVSSNPLNLLAFGMVPLTPFMGYLNAYALLLFVCHFMMGFFTFRLCRRTLGLGLLPSLIAGAIYATNMGMKERVDIIPGGFVVLPLVVESAYRFSRDNFVREAIISGGLLAIGFYFSSLVGVVWCLVPFIFILVYRFFFEKKYVWQDLRSSFLFLFITLVSFSLLSSAVLMPFVMSLFNSELSLIGPTHSRLVEKNFFIDIPQFLRFFNRFIVQQIIPFTEFKGAAFVRYKLPLFSNLNTGYWNSYSILFLPSLFLVIAKFGKLSKTHKIVLSAFFTLILVEISLWIVPLKNLITILSLRHGIFVKMDSMLNLFGGLTVAIGLNYLLKTMGMDKTRAKDWGLKLFKSLLWVLLAGSAFFSCAYFLYLLSPEIAHKLYLYFNPDGTKTIGVFMYSHKYLARSELTPWLYVFFFSKVFTITLVLSLFKCIRLKTVISVLAGIMLLVCADRIATLNLFASFNAYAKNTVSEELPLTRFFLSNLKPYDRVVAINCKDKCGEILFKEYDYPNCMKPEWGLVEFVSLIKPRIKDWFIDGNPFRWMANKYWDVNLINGSTFSLSSNTLPSIQKMSGNGPEYKGAGLYLVHSTESRLLDIFGTRYVLSSGPIDDPRLHLAYRQVDETICTYVYENEAAFPRAWLVNEVRTVKDRNEIYDMMENERVDLRKTALVTNSFPGTFSRNIDYNENTPKITLHEPNKVEIEVNSRNRALLVLSDTYFKGWTATLNDNPTMIHEVNGFMRGVVVEKGHSMVKFKYRPFNFYIFLYLNIAAIFLVVVYLFFPVIRRRFSTK